MAAVAAWEAARQKGLAAQHAAYEAAMGGQPTAAPGKSALPIAPRKPLAPVAVAPPAPAVFTLATCWALGAAVPLAAPTAPLSSTEFLARRRQAVK